MPTPPLAPGRAAWLGEWDYAHRGLHSAHVPENSLAAFRAAIARGLGIELDIQLASDGRAFVFHDETLDRMTESEGRVDACDTSALKAIRIKGSVGETLTPLDEVLADIGDAVPVLVEIKAFTEVHRDLALRAAPVRDCLRAHSGAIAVMSFDPRLIRWFARHAPDIVRGLVMSKNKARPIVARLMRHIAIPRAKPDFIAYDVRDLPASFARRQQRAGRTLLTWTVNSRARLATARAHADAAIAEGPGADGLGRAAAGAGRATGGAAAALAAAREGA